MSALSPALSHTRQANSPLNAHLLPENEHTPKAALRDPPDMQTTASPRVQAAMNNFFPEVVFSLGSDFESSADERHPWMSCLSPEVREPVLAFSQRQTAYTPCEALPLRPLLDYSHHPLVVRARQRMKKYVCRYCGEVLAAGCALGGHITKFHSNVTRRSIRRPRNR